MLSSTERKSFFAPYSFREGTSISLADFAAYVVEQPTKVQEKLDQIKAECHEDDQTFLKWVLYRCLTISGGIYAFFAAFDGMSAVLTTLFPLISISALTALCLVAALSGLGVFLARDKFTIAEELNIKEELQVDLVNDYLFHLEKYYNQQYQKSLEDPNDLTILNHLQAIRNLKVLFDEKSNINQAIIGHSSSYAQTQMVVGIGAILFFSDGFFIGQSLAMYISPFLAINPAVLVLTLAIMIGFMALLAYWYCERPYVENYFYQDLFTDESKVKAALGRINQELNHLEQLKCAQSSNGHTHVRPRSLTF
jgi:hypothetical protein